MFVHPEAACLKGSPGYSSAAQQLMTHSSPVQVDIPFLVRIHHDLAVHKRPLQREWKLSNSHSVPLSIVIIVK